MHRPNQAHFLFAGDHAQGLAELLQVHQLFARGPLANVAEHFERAGFQSDPMVLGRSNGAARSGQQQKKGTAGAARFNVSSTVSSSARSLL